MPRILGGMQEGLNQRVSSASHLGAGRQSVPDLEQVFSAAWQSGRMVPLVAGRSQVLAVKATLHWAAIKMLQR